MLDDRKSIVLLVYIFSLYFRFEIGMGKMKKADFSSVEKQFKELNKKIKDLTEKNKELEKKLKTSENQRTALTKSNF